MKKIGFFFMALPTLLGAEVGLIPAGQSLWWISKRIGQTADVIESKLDTITAACEATVLSSSDISGGTITISSAGLYCLSQDVTANISIEASCVSLNLNNRTVTGTITVGNNSSDCAVFNGFIETLENSMSSSAFAVTIESGTRRIRLHNLIIVGGNGASDGNYGFTGIFIGAANDIMIIDCEAYGGDARGPTSGGEGGFGIQVNGAIDILIRDCICIGGNGADSTIVAGSGGVGIIVSSSTRAEIKGCLVFATGNGGDGGVTNGAGGFGITIANTCEDIAVHDCIIRNTGSAGSGGGAPSFDGLAINDDVPVGSNESIIYRNVAHNIANTIRYDFRATGVEGGVSMTNPPTNIPRANQFINFYM